MVQTPIVRFFGIKFNFNRIKSATEFRCVKTSIVRVVKQSISYEITTNIGRKVFPSTWNIALNWTTPLLLARHMLSALLNNVMSKIQSGQLHSKLFGRRYSTLQSHGLFALAKPLFYFRHKIWRRLEFCNPNLKFPWVVSYSTTHCCDAYAKNYACYERKRQMQCTSLHRVHKIGHISTSGPNEYYW